MENPDDPEGSTPSQAGTPAPQDSEPQPIRPPDPATEKRPYHWRQYQATGRIDETPKIWIADLERYNAGVLRGFWCSISIIKDADELRSVIKDFLEEIGNEEHAIHDYDNLPSSLGEYPDLDKVVEIARMVETHGPALINGYVGYFGIDDAGHDHFEESFRGIYDDGAEFAEELIEETGDQSTIGGGDESIRDSFRQALA